MSSLQQKEGGQSETLLNTGIAHSNSADLLLFAALLIGCVRILIRANEKCR